MNLSQVSWEGRGAELGKIHIARKILLGQREIEGVEAGVSGKIKGWVLRDRLKERSMQILAV